MSALDTRNPKRSSLFLMGDLTIAGQGTIRAKVRNLSDTGLMADVPGNTVCGAAVQVVLRNIGRVTGRIAWVHGTRCGIAFDTPIDAALAQVRDPAAAPEDDVRRPYRRPALDVPWHQRPGYDIRPV